VNEVNGSEMMKLRASSGSMCS